MATRRRVLVADDDAEILDALAGAIERDGAEVSRAASGAELIQRVAEEGPFDLVVTDISMPWMSGVQVANSIRNAGLETALLVITAMKNVDAGQLRALGDNVALLRKPFDMAQLFATIETLIPSWQHASSARA